MFIQKTTTAEVVLDPQTKDRGSESVQTPDRIMFRSILKALSVFFLL